MKVVLDTNVVSELMRAQPDARVVQWVDTLPSSDLFVTAITAAELIRGVDRLPRGKRRDALATALAQVLDVDFANRILAFDSAAAVEYSGVVGNRESAGRPISMADAMIAATVIAAGASHLATRNVSDFEQTGIDIVNPWLAEPPNLAGGPH